MMIKEFFAERFFLDERRRRWNRIVNWPVLFGVAFLWWMASFLWGGGPVFSPDSDSYIVAMENLRSGRMDLERTPGVPLVLWGCELLAGKGYLWVFCFLQEVVFLGSVLLLWDMGRMFVRSRGLVIGITALYLFLPCLSLFHYASGIDTESMAFGTIMLLLWMSLRILRGAEISARESVATGIGLNIVLLFSIAVRPAYIYLIPIYAVFWCFLMFRRRSRAVLMGVTGLMALGGVVGVVGGYEERIEQEFGYEGITDISYMNNYFFAREYNLLLPELAENDSLRSKLREFAALPPEHLWHEIVYLERFDHNYREMNRVVTASFKAQPARCVSAFLRRSANVGAYRMWDYSFDLRKQQVYSVFVPRMSCLYLFIAIYFGFIVWQWKRECRFPDMGFFLWGFVVCSHLAAIAGAQDEWSRLTFQAFPAVLLLFGKIASLFSLKRGKALSVALED